MTLAVKMVTWTTSLLPARAMISHKKFTHSSSHVFMTHNNDNYNDLIDGVEYHFIVYSILYGPRKFAHKTMSTSHSNSALTGDQQLEAYRRIHLLPK